MAITVYNTETKEEVSMHSRVSARRLVQRTNGLWSFEKPKVAPKKAAPKKKAARKS